MAVVASNYSTTFYAYCPAIVAVARASAVAASASTSARLVPSTFFGCFFSSAAIAVVLRTLAAISFLAAAADTAVVHRITTFLQPVQSCGVATTSSTRVRRIRRNSTVI